MSEKAKHRQAARAHKALVRAVCKLKRDAEKELRRIYPVRVGQVWANHLGARYLVQAIDWGIDVDYKPWPHGPLVVLKFDSVEFVARSAKYYDELVKECKRVR